MQNLEWTPSTEMIKAYEKQLGQERDKWMRYLHRYRGRRPTLHDGCWCDLVDFLHHGYGKPWIASRTTSGATYDEVIEFATGNRVERDDWLNEAVEVAFKGRDPPFGGYEVGRNLTACYRSRLHTFYWKRDVTISVWKWLKRLQEEEKWKQQRQLRERNIAESRAILMEFRKQLRNWRSSVTL